ncbi:MAG: anti-sigma factor [Ornithinimicrobium sp.]
MTSTSPHVDDLMGAYAIDAVDADERAQVETHLLECERCRLELQDLTEAAVLLSNGHEVAPPADLRTRLMEVIAEQEQEQEHASSEPSPAAPSSARGSGSRALWGLAAAGLLAVGGWGIWQGVSNDLSPIDQVVQADDARTFEAEYEGEQVTVVSSASLDRAVLITEDLPELADDEVYQAWWVNSDEQILSAGVLDNGGVDAPGEAELEGDPAEVVAFALSVEPVGGSEQPTTEPVIVVPLQS